jgi:hypothetical protein
MVMSLDSIYVTQYVCMITYILGLNSDFHNCCKIHKVIINVVGVRLTHAKTSRSTIYNHESVEPSNSNSIDDFL